LPYISEHLNVPLGHAALGVGFNRETLAQATTSREAGAHSKAHPATLWPQIKRAPWTLEEDTTILEMKKGDCSWEEIHAALSHQTKATI